MKVVLTVDLVGPRRDDRKGDEIEVSKEHGERLIAKGFAVKPKRGKRGKSNSVGDSTGTTWAGSDATNGD